MHHHGNTTLPWQHYIYDVTSSWALVIEEDSIAGIYIIRFSVVNHDPIRIEFCSTCMGAWVHGCMGVVVYGCMGVWG